MDPAFTALWNLFTNSAPGLGLSLILLYALIEERKERKACQEALAKANEARLEDAVTRGHVAIGVIEKNTQASALQAELIKSVLERDRGGRP